MPGTGLIDLDAAEAAITPSTRAIMPVHVAGRPSTWTASGSFATGYALIVIEDAAHAIGAEWRGRRIGAFGNVTAFSFYVTKNITTVEGGALITEDLGLATEVERLALHGLSLGAWQRFSDAGFRHYEVVAARLQVQHDRRAGRDRHPSAPAARRVDRRAGRAVGALRRAARRICPCERRLRPSRGPGTPATSIRCSSTRTLGLSRDELLEALTVRGIGTGVHYRGVHLHPYYRDKYDLRAGRLSRCERDLGVARSACRSARRSPRLTRTTSSPRCETLLRAGS